MPSTIIAVGEYFDLPGHVVGIGRQMSRFIMVDHIDGSMLIRHHGCQL